MEFLVFDLLVVILKIAFLVPGSLVRKLFYKYGLKKEKDRIEELLIKNHFYDFSLSLLIYAIVFCLLF